MASYRYRITVLGKTGIVLARYQSDHALKIGEEIAIYFKGKSHLVKITSVIKRLKLSAEGEEI